MPTIQLRSVQLLVEDSRAVAHYSVVDDKGAELRRGTQAVKADAALVSAVLASVLALVVDDAQQVGDVAPAVLTDALASLGKAREDQAAVEAAISAKRAAAYEQAAEAVAELTAKQAQAKATDDAIAAKAYAAAALDATIAEKQAQAAVLADAVAEKQAQVAALEIAKRQAQAAIADATPVETPEEVQGEA